MRKRMQKKSKNAFFDIGDLKKSDYQDPDGVKKILLVQIDREDLGVLMANGNPKLKKKDFPAPKGGVPLMLQKKRTTHVLIACVRSASGHKTIEVNCERKPKTEILSQ